ncbi:PH domain-containing protein [Mycobacterium sp. NPDC006124]|uniref:PH domain-containing protein n=1 Tax=Mycobacterium sp. NPDC006124 TaxID=3156729 RepID=UPI0033BA8DEB
MAHFAVSIFTLGLLALVLANPVWFTALLILPIVASLAIARYRTTADRDTVTARTLLGSRSVPWEDVDGLRFDRSSWASAHLKDGSDLRLPAVTFATLPQLTAATDGRVPNPYA